MDRMSHEITYGGAFEAMWADMLGEMTNDEAPMSNDEQRVDARGECRPYAELRQLSESLAMFVPIDLTEPPEPGTLAMQIRNDLKGLLASVWCMGMLTQETRTIEAKYSQLLQDAADEVVRSRARIASAVTLLSRTLESSPKDPAELWPWVSNTFCPCVRTLGRMLKDGTDK